MTERLDRIIEFLEVGDGLKAVERAGYLSDGSRHETDSDHTWHMALFALLLAGETGVDLDLGRVLSMVLIHDMVEIFAGDVVVYDVAAREAAKEREREAAERLYGILPGDLRDHLQGLWEEFEERKTQEAQFARALDRLQAFAQNVIAGGKSWRERGITREVSAEVNREVRDSFPVLTAAFETLQQRADRQQLWAAPATGTPKQQGLPPDRDQSTL